MKRKQRIVFEYLKQIKTKRLPFGKKCKVYNDGCHFVAVENITRDKKVFSNKREITDEARCFDELYLLAVHLGYTHAKLREFLKNGMLEQFPFLKNVDSFVDEHVKKKLHNFYSRIKRFKRKAYLNKWNKFVTITYDDKKHSEASFRNKLRKCLSNLHTRYGWNYMGVFELAPETNRLHFHAFMYIPDGSMVGKIEERQDYSTAQHKMQTTLCNTFFERKFGRNDFEEINEFELKNGSAINYLTKYLFKTNEKIIYSRGIPTELNLFIDELDIATEFEDYVIKYVLFDDCIDSFNIYKPFSMKKYIQSSFFDNSIRYG